MQNEREPQVPRRGVLANVPQGNYWKREIAFLFPTHAYSLHGAVRHQLPTTPAHLPLEAESRVCFEVSVLDLWI